MDDNILDFRFKYGEILHTQKGQGEEETLSTFEECASHLWWLLKVN